MKGATRPVWCESVERGTGRVLSRSPVYVPLSGPANYAEQLCRRLSEVGGTDWRVCDPQPDPPAGPPLDRA